MPFWSVKDFSTNAAAKIASFLINTDQNASAHVIVDSTGAEVIGTKDDSAWDGSASSPSGIALWKYIASKLEAVRALSEAAPAQNETMWTDDTGLYFVRIDNGTSIVWKNLSGVTVSAPGTGARPASSSSSLIDKTSYQATAAATGYSVGDFLDHFVITNPTSGAVVGHFWLNTTTEAKLETGPVSANITPVGTSGATQEAAMKAVLDDIKALLGGALTVGLPAGAATAENQDTANAVLNTVHTDLVSVVAQDTAINDVLGTKADTVWDGTTESPSSHSLWHYIATKVATLRATKGRQFATISNTNETPIVTAGASDVFNDLYGLILTNSGATATKVSVRDVAAGSVVATFEITAGGTVDFILPVDSALTQTTAASVWTAQLSAATTLEVTALYVKSK
jgi:hypothetical protein